MSDPHFGWQCPRCYLVRAPWVPICECQQVSMQVAPEQPGTVSEWARDRDAQQNAQLNSVLLDQHAMYRKQGRIER